MNTFHPRLLEATTASTRMDALCEFIEFWLGPRQPTFGEFVSALAEHSLPMPLKKLYEFAGRWPNWENERPIEWAVPAFSHQDTLLALENLKRESGGKVVFLDENQGVWDCRTLADGDDPPVWCHGDQLDENKKWIAGEKHVCDSLSRFLVTFVLQEISLGSRLYLADDGLNVQFEADQKSATPIWTNGPYVHGNNYNYFLWGDVLVAYLGGRPFFAANQKEGVEFLTKNQSPIHEFRLMMGRLWTLDVRVDGSAHVRFLNGQTDETADAPIGTFDFLFLLEKLSAGGAEVGNWEKNAMVHFYRKGQSGTIHGKHLHDGNLVTSLF